MKIIENFEKIQIDNTYIKPGAYICKIINVKDFPNNEYLQIDFEFVDGEFKNICTDFYKKENKWPYFGTTYRSYKDSAVRFFKAFITAIEKSNQNWVWQWDENKLKDCYFVAVFGEEEYLNDKKEIKISTKLQEIRSVEALNNNEIKIPPLKKLSINHDNNIVEPITEISDDDVPF